ncbi:unannotated protein [freshwater metagenome]|uniref:Unannotated protein n=1 Tax=freshwater metagenome TaxID=449393 RepID=A0A6J7EHB4_9ZZZZ
MELFLLVESPDVDIVFSEVRLLVELLDVECSFPEVRIFWRLSGPSSGLSEIRIGDIGRSDVPLVGELLDTVLLPRSVKLL